MRLTPRQLERIAKQLPPAPPPAANYVTVRAAGPLLHVAGQTPHLNGHLSHRGHVDEPADELAGAPASGAAFTVSPAVARTLAATAALNSLAALNEYCGDLRKISHIVSVTVFVAAAPGFTRHPWVADGASDVFVELLGDAGKHARIAVGVASLPDCAPVEVGVIAQLEDLSDMPPHRS